MRGRRAAMNLSSIWSFLVVSLVIYLAVALFLFLNQSRLLYYPSRAVIATPDRAGLAYESVQIFTDDGVRLDGWFLPADRKARGVLLFFHATPETSRTASTRSRFSSAWIGRSHL